MNDIKKYYLYRALIKRFALPIMVFHMAQIGISTEQIALIGSAGYGAQLLFEFPSGALADRMGYKKTMVFAGVVRTIGLALFLGNGFWWFLASAIVYWIGASFATGTDSAYFFERLKYLGKEDIHKKTLANIRSFSAGVALAFALLAGVVYGIHWTIPFIINILFSAFNTGLTATFGPINQIHDKKKSITSNMVEASRFIVKNRAFRYVALFQIVIFGLVLSVNEFNGGLLNTSGVIAAAVGVVYAVRHFVTSIAGQLFKAVDKKLSDKAMYGSIAIGFAVLFAGYWALDGPLATAVILVLVPIPQTFIQIQYGHQLQEHGVSELRASIGSAVALFSSLVLSGSLLVIGLVSNFFELREVVLGISGLILIIGLTLTRLMAAEQEEAS